MLIRTSSEIRRWFAQQASPGSPFHSGAEFIFTDHRRADRLQLLGTSLREEFTVEPVAYDGDGETYLTIRTSAISDGESVLEANTRFRQLAGTYRVEYLGLSVPDADDKRRPGQQPGRSPRLAQEDAKEGRRLNRHIPRQARTQLNSKIKSPAISLQPNVGPGQPDDGPWWALWPLAAGGTLIIAFAIGLLALQIAAKRQTEAMTRWVTTQGRLTEAGIEYHPGSRGARYELIVKYFFQVDGKLFTGTELDGRDHSGYLGGVQDLAARFAPEAAAVTKNDLSFLNSRKVWMISDPSRQDIAVRHDPADPTRSVMILDNPLPNDTASPFVIWAVLLFLFGLGVAGVGLFAFSVAMTIRKKAFPSDLMGG